MPDIYLCSFASPNLDLSVKRFKKEAKQLNIYKQIKVYRKEDLPNEMITRIKNFNYPVLKMRLYGYACWKPYIVKKFFKEIPENSILQYTDIGCEFNVKGIKRLNDYIKLCNDKNILVFQYRPPDWYKKYNNIKFQEYFEYQYTKSETMESMRVNDDSNIISTEQIWSGCFFIKKNKVGEAIIDSWIKYSEIDNLINDDYSKLKNNNNFKEHRHDQSIFSIICKKAEVFSLSASECEWGEKESKRTWEHLNEFPIQAKRNKKYNLIKRFLNRQIRNFKRRWFKNE